MALVLGTTTDIFSTDSIFKTSPEDNQVLSFQGIREVPTSAPIGENLHYSANGSKFRTKFPDTDDVYIDSTLGELNLTGAGIICIVPIELPHGCIIKSAIVYGTNTAVSWYMAAGDLVGGGNTSICSAKIGSSGTPTPTSTSKVVDNVNYSYLIFIDPLSAFDIIYGLSINYST